MPPAYYATESVIGIAAAIVGILGTPVTGGTSLALLAPSVFAVIDGVDNLHDYFVDNGDGTFTLTPAFMQLVLDEQKRQEESYFHDFQSIQNFDGTYNIAGYASGPYNGSSYEYDYRIYYGTSSLRPFALLYPDPYHYDLYTWDSSKSGINRYRVLYVTCDFYGDGKFYRSGSTASIGIGGDNNKGVNVPLFYDIDAAISAFESGNFRGALNYREPLFEYGSIYAPVYTGGSVRISKSVLDGFEDELKKVNDKYDDVDDKINALYEYIFNGGNSGGVGNGGGFDFDFDFPFDMDDLWDLLEDPFEFGAQFIQEMFDFFKEIAGELTRKFPFCIPWDIYRLFNILSGSSGEAATVSLQPYDIEPDQGVIMSLQEYGIAPDDIQLYAGSRDAPYFELPIVIERYGIDERIIVDMAPFQPVSTLSRFLFTIVFCVGLIKFTVKFTEMLKGVFD